MFGCQMHKDIIETAKKVLTSNSDLIENISSNIDKKEG